MKQDPEVRSYRVEMEIPRVARDGTTWRTLVVKDSYSEVSDLTDNLLESMALAGISSEEAWTWVTKHLRVIPESRVTTRAEPEPMPTGR